MNNDKITDYDDIIRLPHHVSARHPHMPARDRAAQFAPFAALTCHGAAIAETARLTSDRIELSEDAKALLDMKQQVLTAFIHTHPEISVTYFRPDKLKNGGAYITVSGRLASMDEIERTMVMESGERIGLDSVTELESELFARVL